MINSLVKGNRLYAAEGVVKNGNVSELLPIIVSRTLTRTPIEASGICYNEATQDYIVISDETDGKKPVLYSMNEHGTITAQSVIEGISKVNDCEGITKGPEGYYFVIASQSHNKKGRLAKSRKLLLSVKRQGTGFSVSGSVSLYDCLLHVATNEPDSEWARFFIKGVQQKDIDIEGIAYTDDTLLLGFKNPKKGNCAVVLGISNTGDFLNNARLEKKQVFVWNTLTLLDSVSGSYCGVADLYMHDNGVLVGTATAVSEKPGMTGDVGLVWRYNPRSKKIKVVKRFTATKPEGITYNVHKDEYCIVFDNGSKRLSNYMKVKAPL